MSYNVKYFLRRKDNELLVYYANYYLNFLIPNKLYNYIDCCRLAY